MSQRYVASATGFIDTNQFVTRRRGYIGSNPNYQQHYYHHHQQPDNTESFSIMPPQQALLPYPNYQYDQTRLQQQQHQLYQPVPRQYLPEMSIQQYQPGNREALTMSNPYIKQRGVVGAWTYDNYPTLHRQPLNNGDDNDGSEYDEPVHRPGGYPFVTAPMNVMPPSPLPQPDTAYDYRPYVYQQPYQVAPPPSTTYFQYGPPSNLAYAPTKGFRALDSTATTTTTTTPAAVTVVPTLTPTPPPTTDSTTTTTQTNPSSSVSDTSSSSPSPPTTTTTTNKVCSITSLVSDSPISFWGLLAVIGVLTCLLILFIALYASAKSSRQLVSTN